MYLKVEGIKLEKVASTHSSSATIRLARWVTANAYQQKSSIGTSLCPAEFDVSVMIRRNGVTTEVPDIFFLA